MKKKKEIMILGSTGSIGKSLINILKKYKSEIKINLLSTNTNLKKKKKRNNDFGIYWLDWEIFNKYFKKIQK